VQVRVRRTIRVKKESGSRLNERGKKNSGVREIIIRECERDSRRKIIFVKQKCEKA
jgi:hypothetical protein